MRTDLKGQRERESTNRSSVRAPAGLRTRNAGRAVEQVRAGDDRSAHIYSGLNVPSLRPPRIHPTSLRRTARCTDSGTFKFKRRGLFVFMKMMVQRPSGALRSEQLTCALLSSALHVHVYGPRAAPPLTYRHTSIARTLSTHRQQSPTRFNFGDTSPFVVACGAHARTRPCITKREGLERGVSEKQGFVRYFFFENG